MATAKEKKDEDLFESHMQEILDLTAPPMSDEFVKQQKKEEREQWLLYRKPKGNRDRCDLCGEDGDLMCCDKCPAAFHLLCSEPPLEEADVDAGAEWLCYKCRMSSACKEKDKAYDSDVSEKSGTSERSMNLPKRRGRPPKGRHKLMPEHMLSGAVKAALNRNPVQFSLPPDMIENTPLPPLSKLNWHEDPRPNSRGTHEKQNGLVPLPARLCHNCGKSCLSSPLIACDFCSLVYHLDCLNPPLTTAPTMLWMCPAHIQHFLDSRLMKDDSLTHRISLWRQYAQQYVQPEQVIKDFVSKIRPEIPAFTWRQFIPRTNTVKIPDAVKSMYRCRRKLLPSRARRKRLENTVRSSNLATRTEQLDWLSGLSALQSRIVANLYQKRTHRKSSSSTDGSLEIDEEIESKKLEADINSRLVDAHEDKSTSIENSRTMDSVNHDRNQCRSPIIGETGLCNSKQIIDEADCLDINGAKTSTKGNGTLAHVLSNGSIDQPLDVKKRVNGVISPCNLNGHATDVEIKECISPDQTRDKTPADMDAMDDGAQVITEKQKLAAQRIRELLDMSNEPRESRTMTVAKQHLRDLVCNEVRSRAVLVLTAGPAVTVPMVYSTLSLGKSSSACDVDLSRIRRCRFISDHHATIFFDKTSSSYELLNYSEHGTCVDGVCVWSSTSPDSNPSSADRQAAESQVDSLRTRSSIQNDIFQNKSVSLPEFRPPRGVSPLVAGVRHVIRTRSTGERSVNSFAQNPLDSRVSDSLEETCTCQTSRPPFNLSTRKSRRLDDMDSAEDLTNGWEGSVLLHHGSVIQFGCVSLVFGLVTESHVHFKEDSQVLGDFFKK